MIPYGRQDISQKDIDAVTNVLKSDFLTQGPAVPRFERAVAQKVNAQYSVAVNSATSALHIACMALGLKRGDWLWTTPITFVASANCGLYCGAKINFVDIDPKTFNMCADKLATRLEQAEKTGTLPKVIIPVHMCGQPCDMEIISTLAKKYGVHVIEDASHAVGGRYQGAPIGNCAFSDITIFSFHPVKIITTAEGGLALTNNGKLAEQMALFRSHGITRDPSLMTHASDGPWYYQQVELGYNYRMTEMQAALGCSQLEKLDGYVSRRHEQVQIYDAELANLSLQTPWQHSDSYSAFHLYIIRLQLENCARTHRETFEYLRDNGIGVNLHYIPVHLQPYYVNFGFKAGDFPEAERYYKEAISIPLYPTMDSDAQDTVIRTVIEAVS